MSDWILRRYAPMPYQDWHPFSPDTMVEVENANGDRHIGRASDFWWGYETEMGRIGEGVILRARAITDAD